jgi:5-formyltetrahydrofolate cyclo-ligase
MDTDKHGWQKQKAELRAKIRAALREISPATRETASRNLCAKLKQQSFFQTAATVLFFAPLPDEVDVWPLLQEAIASNKIVVLPRFDSAAKSYVACRVQNLRSEIVTGQFGVREAKAGCAEIPLTNVDLAFVPGVAFDLRGCRLGRGRGFYDRLLTEVRGVKCGVAFDEQIVDEVPKESHDIRMNFIVTPARCAFVKS